MRKKIFTLFTALVLCNMLYISHAQYIENDMLRFTPAENIEERVLELPNGKKINYRAYENIYYVSNVIDPVYQYLNFYVPETAYENNSGTPIFLKTNIGGYMAARASTPSAKDATGRALQEGYIVVIPGSRGSNSTITDAEGETIYTGRAPYGLIDLKAAIRYLRYNDGAIPGNKERIITDGTSAGGAMSALLGATGNHPLYEPYLEAAGAAKERDDIFAAVCFCPITDLEHADMAYEWLYNYTDTNVRELTAEQTFISHELAALYPSYLENMELEMPDGTSLDSKNYRDYVKSFIIQSAQKAQNRGEYIPIETGIIFNPEGDEIVDMDLDTYLQYVISTRQLKTPPAFDQMGVLVAQPSPENNLFGDSYGNPANFTDYSFKKSEDDPEAILDSSIRERVYIMNPMNFIGNEDSNTAQNWYIRHGAIDRDTSFFVPINLYTKLMNNSCNVNFALAWDKAHTGDYDLDELFEWIRSLLY